MTSEQRKEFWEAGRAQLELQVEQARVNVRLMQASLKALEAELAEFARLCEECE